MYARSVTAVLAAPSGTATPCVLRRRVTGYGVLLTNDSGTGQRRDRPKPWILIFVCMKDGRSPGELMWGAATAAGTMRTREGTLAVTGSYALRWQDYSVPAIGAYGRFRYLAVPVTGAQCCPPVAQRVADAINLARSSGPCCVAPP
jgi:hypothetical protein